MSIAAGVAGVASFGLPTLTEAERALATPEGAVNLDFLYIGAHPDDEAGSLGAFGQWIEALGLMGGVVTITRGEGGGNATGFEEGPELGILREAEERNAVGYAGIEHVFNLDALDFYYTASAPLSDRIWGEEALLSRIVRVIRATRPKMLVTMNPAAVEGNHGNHQQAAVYAVEAFYAAADPARFPEHLEEGFEVWRPQRLLRGGASGRGGSGPDAVTDGFTPSVNSDLVFGSWNGTWSERYGERWSVRRDKAIWAYESQGWASRAAAPTDPAAIPVTWFTLLENRSALYDPRRDDLAALDGLFRVPNGGLPEGTEIEVDTDRFNVLIGSTFTMQVHLFSPEGLGEVSVSAGLPDGWSAETRRVNVPANERVSVELEVSVPSSAASNDQLRIWTQVESSAGSGQGTTVVRVMSPVYSEMHPLPEISIYRQWAEEVGVEHLNSLVPTFASIGAGRSEELGFDIINDSDQPRSGTVRLELPEGFESEPTDINFGPIPARQRQEVRFTVTNTDASLPMANTNYDLDVVVISEGVEDRQHNFLNLVPTMVVPRAAAPISIDGTIGDGEYPGEAFDITSFWESEPVPAENLSGRCWLTYDDEALYVALEVQDDHPGVWLPPNDIKRPRRVDAVEIAVDPRGNSADTSTVFNLAVFAASNDPANNNPPRFARERDNWQGGEETAPGVLVASTVSEPYEGYTLEVKIPFAVLPDTLDPTRVGFNIMVNDSDTDDLTSQRRIGWSAFRGVRADPWRWGLLEMQELPSAASQPVAPQFPDTAALSVDSPQSITQAVADGVPLGGWAPLLSGHPVFTGAGISGSTFRTNYEAPQAGRVHIFVFDGDEVLGSRAAQISGSGELSVQLERAVSVGDGVRALASFQVGEEVLALRIPWGSAPDPSPSPSDPTSTPTGDPTPTPTASPTSGGPRPGLPSTGR